MKIKYKKLTHRPNENPTSFIRFNKIFMVQDQNDMYENKI